MYPIAVRRTFSVGLLLVIAFMLSKMADAHSPEQPLPPSTIAEIRTTFLPLVVQIPPSAPPQPAGIVNGNFEAGPQAWAQYSQQGYTIILTADSLPVPPRSGVWAAWLGGAYDEASLLDQIFVVPANATRLAYYLWIASSDVCNAEYDIGGLIMDDDGNLTDTDVLDAYMLCDDNSTAGWIRREVDVTRYAGKEVLLTFAAFTDSVLNSNMFIDDVQLNTAPLQSISAEPFPLLSPIPSRLELPREEAASSSHETGALEGLIRKTLMQ